LKEQIPGATEGTFEAAKEFILNSRIGCAVMTEDGINVFCDLSIANSEKFGLASRTVEAPNARCPPCGFLHRKGLEIAFGHSMHPSCAPISH
jgi:hypothetical protein